MIKAMAPSCNVLNVKVSMDDGEPRMQWAGQPKIWWNFDRGIKGKLGEKKTEVQQNSGGSRKGPDERNRGPN